MSQPITDPAEGQGKAQHPGYWPAWLVFSLALALLVTQYRWLPPTPQIDFYGLITETIICLIPLVGLFVVQHLRPQPRIYWPLMLGLSSLLLSDVTDALDEVRVQPELVGILVEDGLSVLGYALLVWGLATWLDYNRQIRGEIQALNADLERRVTERTASLAAEMAERQQAEEVLRLSEARLRLATDGAELGIWYWDLATQTHDWSERCKRHLGLPPGQEPSLDRFYAAIHPDDRDWVKARGQRLQEPGADPRAEFRVFWADGSLHWISASGRVFRHPDGSPKGIGGITQDITQRNLAEQNLRVSERRFRELFEQLPIAYQSLDGEGRWLDANQKMADLLGFAQPEDMVGLNFGDYWDEATRDQFPATFSALMTTGMTQGEIRLRRRDGSPVTVILTGRIQRNLEGNFSRTHCILTDISERRAMEEAIRDLNATLERKVADRTAEVQAANASLRESEEHLQFVLEGSRLGTWDWNIATGEVSRNDYWAEMLGFTPQEVDDATASGWLELIHPEDREPAWQSIEDHLAGRTPRHEVEYRMRTRQGGYRWILDRARIVSRDDAGRPLRMAGTHEDVTRRKQSEQALAESHQRLLTILNGMEAQIYVADLTTHEVLFMNRSAAQVFGPVEGLPCYQALLGLDAPCSTCNNAQLVNADGSPAGVQAWEFHNQLDQRWYDMRACAVRWTDGRLVRMEIATDITARKEMELRLRQSEEHFRLAFENANTGMCLVDLQGRLLQVNDKMSAIFGYSRQELAGMTVNDLAYPEDQTLSPAFITEAIQGLVDSATFDKRYRHRDGHLIYGQVASSLVRDQQGQPLYFISQVQDVTDRVLASAAADRANAALQAANEELNRLATTDSLTGAWNRRRLEETLVNEMARLQRYGHPLSLMVIDVDYFKQFNDLHGHAAGDQVLARLAAVVQLTLRATDSLARWGGEEFVVLTPNEGLSAAALLAERLRETIAGTEFPALARITVSIGVAECLPGESWAQWFERADAALYRAKAGGRNQVRAAPETPQSAAMVEPATMSPVQLHWRQAYDCGHPLIDRQHQALFEHANSLLAALLSERPTGEIASLIDTLIRDVVQHFHDEEAIITAAGYPDVAEHAARHRDLVDKAGALVSRFQTGTLDLGELFQFLAHDVVSLHMLKSDREYFPYLCQQ